MDLIEKYLGEQSEYYEAEYYDTIGQHGSIGNWPSFKMAYKKAIDLYKREEKDGTIEGTEYIGVSGSGDEFAIIYIKNSYIKNSSPDHFKDKKSYQNWMKVAQKVLRTGKPSTGSYS